MYVWCFVYFSSGCSRKKRESERKKVGVLERFKKVVGRMIDASGKGSQC